MLTACSGGPSGRHDADHDRARARPIEGGRATDDATVLATVLGTRVTAGEVAALAREAQLTPREALDRLVGEVLLAHEAERRGYGGRPEVVAAVQKAAVRAWLAAEVERAVPESSITDADVAATYESQRRRFSRPETREAIHVLVPLATDASEARAAAARRLTERVVSELRAQGPEAVLARYSADPSALTGAFQVTAERVPNLVRGGAFDRAFLEAVFALPAPGIVPAPVRTQFGWHAVALMSIRPDESLPVERAHVIIRRELLAARRGARLGSLTDALAAANPRRDDQQLAARLAAVPQDDVPGAPRGMP